MRASSAAMAITFDAGGRERQEDFWVPDLTEEEATELVTKHGHGDNAKKFLDACGYRALDLVRACERYVDQASLQKKKAQMEKRAMTEVVRFLACKIQTTDGLICAGEKILTALKQNRLQGDGQGVDANVAGPTVTPKKVAKWMREEGFHPVTWHMVDEKFRFASEFHADAAVQMLP